MCVLCVCVFMSACECVRSAVYTALAQSALKRFEIAFTGN